MQQPCCLSNSFVSKKTHESYFNSKPINFFNSPFDILSNHYLVIALYLTTYTRIFITLINSRLIESTYLIVLDTLSHLLSRVFVSFTNFLFTKSSFWHTLGGGTRWAHYVLALGVLGHQFLRAKSLIYYKLDFAPRNLSPSTPSAADIVQIVLVYLLQQTGCPARTALTAVLMPKRA